MIAIRSLDGATSFSDRVITFSSLDENKKSVVAELTENIGGWEQITGALDEMRVCHEENLAFFSGVFDQLDSLCVSLLSREQQLENLTRQIAESTRQAESSPAVKPPSGVAAAASGDPVLESVLAQFELLQ